MSRLIKGSSKKIGLAPGSTVFVGNKKTDKTEISIIDYDAEGAREIVAKDVEDAYPFRGNRKVSWINICGLHDTGSISRFGKEFGIHPLIVEDILNTNQRPKIEIFDEYLFITLRMLAYEEKKARISSEQISLVVGEDYVISFQEKKGDIFDPLRKRISEGKGKIRNNGSDYLVYSILDMVIDNYFLILESISETVEDIEESLVIGKNSLTEVYNLKREVLFLRKSVWPLREAVGKLEKSESELIKKSTHPYLRDLYDHTIQVIDTVETLRDLLAGMLDLHLSTVSNKMNEVMKVLTIIATIFIPLTFIAGVYGMNFENMPELAWKFSYFVVWAFMVGLAGVMLLYFRKRGWL